jgi:hypothetical protein
MAVEIHVFDFSDRRGAGRSGLVIIRIEFALYPYWWVVEFTSCRVCFDDGCFQSFGYRF